MHKFSWLHKHWSRDVRQEHAAHPLPKPQDTIAVPAILEYCQTHFGPGQMGIVSGIKNMIYDLAIPGTLTEKDREALIRLGMPKPNRFKLIVNHIMGNITKNYYDHAQSHDIEITSDMAAQAVEKITKETCGDTSEKAEHPELPALLATEQAMALWKKLQEHGFVNEFFQPVHLNRDQLMYIALLMSEKLKLRYKWEPFQKFWAVKRLSQSMQEMYNTGTLPDKNEEISAIFD